ncbi:hypothetical protein SBRCBS47491_007314 [Sporothrix bragantina]|uniref:Kinesin motor domain-containing protein n=1 Tax=Sporothrix bragantina TaxID=671064 RepID=A0ABP0CEW0_9PEZI
MSVRVVARVRPLLPKELDKDVIVRVDTSSSSDDGRPPNIVKIPSPKNEAEEFSFQFNGVYDQATTQEELFNAEVAPHIKSLFQGLDITLFAYGVTGTGKTHTMRGGMKLADRGVIPRLLSHVFRRGKKMVKDAEGSVDVDVALSYYEIYNDKVYDLLEPPEKRTPTGLPLREKDNKTHVVGLSEQKCVDVRDFEKLYIAANQNRVTASTKLNAHSSRSHAILRVKLRQTTTDAEGRILSIRESTASAIDLAGSEDNRRTDNGRERLVESAAINKSLFVLSQCVDAIARGEKRIPYRESKMTRILSLGQNNGITVMILNLAPVRSYHLDTLSSLTVSSRAKRIEVREIENEVVFKQLPRSLASSTASSASSSTTSLSSSTTMSSVSSAGSGLARQPLRALTSNTHNIQTGNAAAKAAADKPAKMFMVYTDRKPATTTLPAPQSTTTATTTTPGLPTSSTTSSLASTTSSRMGPLSSLTRTSLAANKASHSSSSSVSEQPRSKLARPSIHPYPSTSNIGRPSLAPMQPPPAAPTSSTPMFSAEQIEAIVERKVAEALAARAQEEQEQQQQQRLAQYQQQQDNTLAFTTMFGVAQSDTMLSEAVQKRLEALERRIEDSTRVVGSETTGKTEDDPRAEGLRYLLLARQHKEVGDDAVALHYYEQALPFFPGQAKLLGKIDKLKAKMARRRESGNNNGHNNNSPRKAYLSHHEPEQQRLQKRKRAVTAVSTSALATPTTPTFRRIARSTSTADMTASEGNDDHEADADIEEDEEDKVDNVDKASLSIPKDVFMSPLDKSPRRRNKFSPGRKAARTSLWLGPSSAFGGNGEDADDESRSLGPLSLTMTPRKKKLLDIINSRDEARIRGLAGVSANTARGLVDYLERGGGVGGRIEQDNDDEDLSPAATPIHRIETLAQLRNVPGMGGETVERAYEGLVAIQGGKKLKRE